MVRFIAIAGAYRPGDAPKTVPTRYFPRLTA
jgi:hypothetical protein